MINTPPLSPHALKHEISEQAHLLGFDLVGFARSNPFPDAQKMLEERVAAGLLSGLTWFTADRARVAGDPHNLMPEVKTLVSLGISYLSDEPDIASQPGSPRGRVARYAWGLDYHEVFKDKLTALH